MATDSYFHPLPPSTKSPTDDTGQQLEEYTSALSPPIIPTEQAEYIPATLTPNDEYIQATSTPNNNNDEEKLEINTDCKQRIASPTIPSLPLDLSQHKIAIASNWIPIIFSGGLLPIIFYFSLHYTTSLQLRYILTIPLVLTAIVTLGSLGKRIYTLLTQESFRPLNGSRKYCLDFFTWNYIFGFILVTILISVGIGIENLSIVSLPLSVLIAYICAEMIIAEIWIFWGWKAPFRISSIPKGGVIRPAVHVIAEDVVAVEGGMRRVWREVWVERYEKDVEMREFLRRMDWVWGLSGIFVVGGVWGVIFGVGNAEVGFVVGWVVPWCWAGGLTGWTIWRAKGMLKRSRRQNIDVCVS